MEKNTRKIVIQKHLLLALIMVVIVASALSRSYGAEGRNLRYGFSVFGGTGDAWHNETDMTVYGFLPCVDLALHRNWDLEFEGNYSYWNIARECDLYFLGVDANILFKPIQRNWGSLFLLAGGGLGYNNADNRVREIGDSHCGGILQGGTGFYYNFGKKLALRVEYRFYHTSDPFRKDIGLDTHNFLLGISF
jgi:opacity protein-like surface antigen